MTDTKASEGGVQLGGECKISNDPSCLPGLVCDVETGDAGICTPAAATSPHVAGVRLQGLQPKSGSYVGEAGTPATASIQTVNAKTVTAQLKIVGQEPVQLDVVAGDGGGWTADFTVPNASADLVVTAVGEDGKDRSSLVLHIALTSPAR